MFNNVQLDFVCIPIYFSLKRLAALPIKPKLLMSILIFENEILKKIKI